MVNMKRPAKKMISKMKEGFTIIELMLAMTFVSILMVLVAILVINMTDIFTKGVTIRDLNSTGRLVMDDIVRAIAASPPLNTGCPNVGVCNPSNKRFFLETTNGGRFCTGVYSYIWNKVIIGEGGVPRVFGSESSDHGANQFGLINHHGHHVALSSEDAMEQFELLTPLRFVKVSDFGRQYCRVDEGGSPERSYVIVEDQRNETGDFLDHTIGTMIGRPIELLGTSETDLAIADFVVFRPSVSSAAGQVFYSVSFVLSTIRGVQGSGDGAITPVTCQPPAVSQVEFNYCAINKFNVAMRTSSQSLVDR